MNWSGDPLKDVAHDEHGNAYLLGRYITPSGEMRDKWAVTLGKLSAGR